MAIGTAANTVTQIIEIATAAQQAGVLATYETLGEVELWLQTHATPLVNDLSYQIGSYYITQSASDGSFAATELNVIFDELTNTYSILSVGSVITAVATSTAISAACVALGIGLGVGVNLLAPEVMQSIGDALYNAGETVKGKVLFYVDYQKNTRISKNAIKIIGDKLLELGLYNAGEATSTIPKTPNVRYNSLRTMTTDEAIYKTISLVQNNPNFPNNNYIANITACASQISALASQYDYIVMSVRSGQEILQSQYGLTYSDVTLYLRNNNFTAYSAEMNTDKIINGDLSRIQYVNAWRRILAFATPSGNLNIWNDVEGVTPDFIYTGLGVSKPQGMDNEDINGIEKNRTSIAIGTNFGVDLTPSNPVYTPIPDSVKPVPDWEIDTTYPDWHTNGVYNTWVDPQTGELKRRPLYPLSIPTVDPLQEGTPNTDQERAQEGIFYDPPTPEVPDPKPLPYPSTVIIDGLDPLVNPDPTDPIIPNIPTPNNPAENTGETPAIPPATSGSGTGFITVYNPTETEMQSFGGWLWADAITTLIRNIFQNPMDAIIGLHLIYVTPTTGSAVNPKVGYITCDATTMKKVTNQYKEINCGTINVNEFFHNVNDYSYTDISLYLPFVGIVPLETAVIMGTALNVKYEVDVYTGACLAIVSITKDGKTAAIAQYSGSCSAQLPITSGDASRLFEGIVATIGGYAVGGFAGAAAGANMIQPARVQKSGTITSCVGAMGIKTPYLIITRPVTNEALQYSSFYGYPTNLRVLLGNVGGFTKVKDIHLEGINGTEEELREIETLLKEGVIF